MTEVVGEYSNMPMLKAMSFKSRSYATAIAQIVDFANKGSKSRTIKHIDITPEQEQEYRDITTTVFNVGIIYFDNKADEELLEKEDVAE
jgi:hypothetical protein